MRHKLLTPTNVHDIGRHFQDTGENTQTVSSIIDKVQLDIQQLVLTPLARKKYAGTAPQTGSNVTVGICPEDLNAR